MDFHDTIIVAKRSHDNNTAIRQINFYIGLFCIFSFVANESYSKYKCREADFVPITTKVLKKKRTVNRHFLQTKVSQAFA